MQKTEVNTIFLETALKKGDETAFKMLFETYYDQLTIYVNSFTNDQDTTKDIIQDTFIKLWNSKTNFDFHQSILGYLYKTAYFTFIDKYRLDMKERKFLDDHVYKKRLELLNTEDEEMRQKKIDQVSEAIENLPPKCKEIFKMSKLQGYKYKEIANMKNISIKTVEAQMAKAFSRLRSILSKKGTINLFFSFFSKQTKENVLFKMTK
ncbi:RNA polymerase sigma-70 factor [Flavobacteriaceae bacterium F08102]|nr:RNA polymerase sigma-70 factor [Flavobacteriaceae bacterium F08102]